MVSFQKLLKTTGGTLERMQAELAAHNPPVHPLLSAAEARYAALRDPIDFLHGSPHVFDNFDFDSNLLKGEGALAFGPGGYFTGHEDLAREYARTLYKRHAGADNPHKPANAAAAMDPRATAEYLRALQIANLQRAGWNDLSKPLGIADMPYTYGSPNPSGKPRFIEHRPYGLLDYAQSAADEGIDIFGLPRRIGKGGLSPAEVVTMGQKLIPAAERVISPKVVQRQVRDPRLEEAVSTLFNLPWQDRAAYRAHIQRMAPNHLFSTPAGLAERSGNLRAIQRFETGDPSGDARVSMSMGGSGPYRYLDLRNPKPVDLENKFERSLYRTQGPGFADMLSYDYPLYVNTPEVLSPLAQLASKKGVELKPNMSGREALGALGLLSQKGASALQAKRALAEAGIPALYYERGGRRSGTPPSLPDPADYNFVVFDDDVLKPPTREKFANGGYIR